MDANYIVNRLKSSPYKNFTVQVLKNRLENLDENQRGAVYSGLKVEVHRHHNFNIHEYLRELLNHKRLVA